MSKVKSKRNVGRGSSSKGTLGSGGKVLSKRQLKKSSNKRYLFSFIIFGMIIPIILIIIATFF